MSASLATLLVLGSLLCSGGMDSAQWQLHTFYGLDCRPEKLHDGKWVPVKQGSADAKGDTHVSPARP